MAERNFVEPCNGCQKATACPVPPALARVMHAWDAPRAIEEFPFVEIVSSWRQDNSLLVKLQCQRYQSARSAIFTY